MGSRRTRSDVKRMREQWKKPYDRMAEELEDQKLDTYFEEFREQEKKREVQDFIKQWDIPKKREDEE